MNCEQAKRNILLEDSDELSSRQASTLAKHLVQCSECRSHRDSTLGVIRTTKEALPAGEPSTATVKRIMIAANQPGIARINRRPIHIVLRPVWQAAAYAAMFLLILAGIHMYIVPSDPITTQGNEVEEVSTIVAIMIEDAATSAGIEAEESVTSDQKKLAMQLLRLEGLYMEADEFEEDANFILSPDPMSGGPASSSNVTT
jgi:hypothetical protein